MRPLQFRIFPLLLEMVLLLWQLCLVYHQTEHGLDEPDEICLLCQAADHMQHGLGATVIAASVPTALDIPDTTPPFIFPQFLRAPSARSPPFGLPA